MKIQGVLRLEDDGNVHFWCPGCEESHEIDLGTWAFNEDCEKPTFAPSVLVQSGHYSSAHKAGDSCWCNFEECFPEKKLAEAPFKCKQCRSFVREGQIQFLTDSSHGLAGKVVELPPYPIRLS